MKLNYQVILVRYNVRKMVFLVNLISIFIKLKLRTVLKNELETVFIKQLLCY